jgi:CDP-6-deoxy-D-xylo-4-hexulose-3-dehydrase
MEANEVENLENTIKTLFGLWAEKKQKEYQDREKVQYSGPVLGKEEYHRMLDAIFANWWSGGYYTLEAEKKLAEMSIRNHALLANSGSSANLMLMSAARELYFEDGDKIITLSCGFPTTVNPIITSFLRPVFVDVDLKNLGLNPSLFEEVVKKDKKVRGVFVAHTLGLKSEIDEILDVARKYDIVVFFDSCDAYGTFYKGRPIQQYGKASTFSFYVAHHATMGEGGGVVTNDDELHLTMRGFRNWGKYCASPDCCIRSLNPEAFCPTTKLTYDGELPDDYMVNYQYEWMGYNLKPLELQGAILYEQLNRLEGFNQTRRENYKILYDFMKGCKFDFHLWEIDEETSPFSFGFIIPEDAPFKRKHLIDYLKQNKVESRLLFGGNLMKHPAYSKKKHLWECYGEHKNSDVITERFLMLGVSQINGKDKTEKVVGLLEDFFKKW